ncbi:hypothetical protein KCU65_g1948, partial [Aureobasidium melanogenum]
MRDPDSDCRSDITGDTVRSYILQALNPGDSASQLSKEKLDCRVKLITEFIPQIDNPPFNEIWRWDEKRIGRFTIRSS